MTLYRPLVDVATDYRRWAMSDDPRVATGYEIMDSRTNGGAAFGEVILFQCRSQVGKTTWGLNVIENNRHRQCAFFSLEMHGRYLVPRLAAMHTNTPTHDIENELKATGRSAAVAQMLEDYDNRLAIIDKPAMSLKQMGEALDEFEDQSQKKTELIVIDFLELIGGVPSLSTLDKIDGLTRKIKDFSRERDLVTIILHQVGRDAGGTGAEPLDITSSRYGGEVSADYVLAAYRPALRRGISQEEYIDERWVWYCQFLKTRGGSELHPSGLLHCLNPFTMRISYPYPQVPLFADFLPEEEEALV